MKVGVFLPSGSLGGAEQVLLQISNAYADKGAVVNVYLLTNINASDFKKRLRPEVNLISFDADRESKGIFKFFNHFLLKFKRDNFDYAYSSHVHINAFIAILRRFSLIKIKRHIARESTLIFDRFTGNRLRLFDFSYNTGYQNIDLIICQTELMKAQLLKHKPKLSEKKVVVINNPITPLSKTYNFSNPYVNKQFLVSAGRLIPEKGFDILIDAFKILNQQNPELELVILGEGKSREILQNQINNEALQQKIHMPGFADDVYSYFTYAKVCVVSSRIEGFPNVLLQMMACNNHVVSTLCAGGIDKIKGIITCNTNDINGLVSAIKKSADTEENYNREVFDQYLKANDINNYIEKIEYLVSHKL